MFEIIGAILLGIVLISFALGLLIVTIKHYKEIDNLYR